MEIRVNKEAREKLHQEELRAVLITAQLTANTGKDCFYHSKIRGNGLSSHELIEMVEKTTNGTVYAGYGAISDGLIKFWIKD